jgi:hypothetical protein
MNRFLTLFIVATLAAPAVFANGAGAMKEEIQSLRQQLQLLEQRLDAQSQQIEAQEMKTDRLTTIEEESLSYLQSLTQLKDLTDRITISGNLDILAQHTENDRVGGAAADDTNESDILIDQARLNLDVDVCENVQAYISLQYEDYDSGTYAGSGTTGSDTESALDDLHVDEAYITWAFSETFAPGETAMYLKAGQQFFPFGNVDDFGNFINDTLARQLYETRDTGALVGLTMDQFAASVFVFNGEDDETIDGSAFLDNQLETFGASLSYTHNEEDMGLKLGVSYLSNLYQAQNSTGGLGVGNYDDALPAVNLYGVLSMGQFSLSAEWVGAIDDADADDDPQGGGAEPEALSIEATIEVNIADRDITLAGKWEQNHDVDDFSTASAPVETVYGLSAGTDICENTRLTLNYEYQEASDDTAFDAAAGVQGGHAHWYGLELSVYF